MTAIDIPVELAQIACEICLKEVPLSEAENPEAEAYVAISGVWRALKYGSSRTEINRIRIHNPAHESIFQVRLAGRN